MKNIISLSVFACLFVLTSCSKEDFPLPQMEQKESMTTQNLQIVDSAPVAMATSVDEIEQTLDVPTMEVRVSRITATQVGEEYIVDFAGDFNFTAAKLLANQSLQFTDANGVTNYLTLQVNNAVGSDGTLQVAFTIGTYDLTGWSLMTVQDIIIEDDLIV